MTDCLSTAGRILWRRLGILVLGNIIWLLLSLTIVLWPAATAGLYTLVTRIIEEETEGAKRLAQISDFWQGFRMNWLPASVLLLINFAVFFLITVAVVFYGGSSAEPLRWVLGPVLVILLAWVVIQLYLLPTFIQRRGASIRDIMLESLLLGASFPIATLALLAISLFLLVLAIALAGPFLLVYFSGTALLQTLVYRMLLRRRDRILGRYQSDS